jgi:type III restriction enzyme
MDKNNVSLELAKRLSDKVNAAWTSGEMLEEVSPTTAELLKWWFSDEYCEIRT